MIARRFVDAYVRRLRRLNVAPSTLKAYLFTARRFVADVGKPLARVTRADVRRYLAARADGLTASSQAAELSRVRVFLAALVDEDLLAASPAEGLVSKRPTARPPTLLSELAVERLLRAASIEGRLGRVMALRDRTALELAYGLGLRWRWAGWSVVGVLAHLAARRSGPDRHRDLPAWALTVAGPTPLA